jgi:triphosphoribosyl-dephospho-CoA synthase
VHDSDASTRSTAADGVEIPVRLPIGVCCTLACQFEALAAKPGNVQRGVDFEDLSLADLLVCGAVLAPVLEQAAERRLGETILAGVRASRTSVQSNANLGIVLLLAPLAKVPRGCSLESGVERVLAELTQEDAADVFAAIREAQPGGLGTAPEADVAAPPTLALVDAMRLAAERDLVARQYATDFSDLFGCIVPWLTSGVERGESLSRNIVRVHLQMMSKFPDSLIQRKCGAKIAQESADRAADVLLAQQRSESDYEQALADFDFWLRVDGHRRNPGTTADMLAAGLFVLLREGVLKPPFCFYEC